MEDFNSKTFNPLLKRISNMSEKLPRSWSDADIRRYQALTDKSLLMKLFLTAETPRKIFDIYMIAKHAPYRNAYIESKTEGNVMEGSGVSQAESDAVVSIFEQYFTKSEVSEFWDGVEKATDVSLNAWRDTGRITPEAYAELKSALPYYVPLRGWDESETDEAMDAVYTGSAGSNAYSAFTEAKGRGSIAGSPLSYMAQTAQSALVFKEKNDANQLLFRLAESAKQADLLTPKMGYTVETLDSNGNVTSTQDVAVLPATLQTNQRIIKKSMVDKKKLADGKAVQHDVDVWINGKLYTTYFADEQVAQEINETTNAVAEWLNKKRGVKISGKLYGASLGGITKGLAALRTQKNPIFWSKNTIRDVQGAATYLYVMHDTKIAAKFIRNIPRAAQVAFIAQFADKEKGASTTSTKLKKYVDYFEEYRKSGSRVGFMQLMELDKLKRDIEKAVKNEGKINSATFLHRALRAVNGMASVSEDIARFSAFVSARELGKDVSEASAIAKEVSVNFNRSGKYSAIPGSLYAFFNATVQSAYQLYKMFRVNPARATAAASVHAATGYLMYSINAYLLGLASAAIAGSDDDDNKDRLLNLGNYRKYTNLFLPADEGFAQLPLSQTWRPFYAIGVAAAQVEHKELSVEEAISGVAEQFFNYSPVEVDGNWEQRLPTVLVPIAETFITKRTYLGAPLVSRIYDKKTEEETPNSHRGVRTDQHPGWQHLADLLAGSTPTGKKTYIDKNLHIKTQGGIIDLSPDQIMNLILGFTGGVGVLANDIANLSYTLATGGDFSANKIPLASGFYTEPTPRYYTEKYYRMRQAYENFARNFEFDKKTGRVVEYANNKNIGKLIKAGTKMEAGKQLIDYAQEKQLKQAFEIWDAGEKRLERISLSSRRKKREEVRREVEAATKDIVKEVEPVMKKIGIDY
jgi:hypothetical protein